MTVTHYVITTAYENERLDRTLVALHESYSRQQIQKWIRDGFITVNDKRVKPNYTCKLNDTITVNIPKQREQNIEIIPEKMDLTIIHEDDVIIVLNKPKGLLVHPTQTTKTGTLVNGLVAHSEHLSTVDGKERPGIVHRLDQHTSGLIVVAKTNGAHEQLKKQFQAQSVTRIYEAIVFGNVKNDRGIIKAPIGRNPKNRIQRTVIEGGRDAETHFTVLETMPQHTLVECSLKTGRTHQIRVHMKYMNHPIVGDPLYCRKKSSLAQSQALFAKRLSFIHPATKERVSYEIERPADFEKLLQKIRKKT